MQPLRKLEKEQKQKMFTSLLLQLFEQKHFSLQRHPFQRDFAAWPFLTIYKILQREAKSVNLI